MHVVIVVQNLSVPFDRRVWLECQALRDGGHRVSVICPKGPGDPGRSVIDEVALYKYRPYTGSGRPLDFVVEYLWSFAATAWLLARVWQRRRFDVLQACNPPDIFWPLGLAFRIVGGSHFVFDHHDLCPELFESRFPKRGRGLYWALRALEWCTHRSADHVIATNESYRQVAIGRGGKLPGDVTVVRTGPDASTLRRQAPDPSMRGGRQLLAAYLGVMGPQDGVDIVVKAADIIVHSWGRDDIAFVLMGTGDCFDELVRLRDDLDLGDYVTFTGRASDELVTRVLSTADVGLSPDPKNPLNDVSTMNKTMEYMAFGLPTVAFDLHETRVSAADAAIYAEPNDIDLYAKAMVQLLDDPQLRASMGAIARARVEDELAWGHQRAAYVAIYDSLDPSRSLALPAGDAPADLAPTDEG